MQYIIKVKPHSNSSQTVYWNKYGDSFVHKESDLTPVDSKYFEWFKSSAYIMTKRIQPLTSSKYVL